MLPRASRFVARLGQQGKIRAPISIVVARTAVPSSTFGTSSAHPAGTGEPFYGSPRPPPRECSLESPFDRLQLLLQQAAIALADPTRADAVAAVGELTSKTALQSLQEKLRADAVGRQILQERPLVQKDAIPYDALVQQGREAVEGQLPEADLTFGQAYGRFLFENGFDPDERDEIRFMSRETPEDDELAYILLRYRQSHDFFHTLTGLPPTVLGELALKWLELIQTGLPVAAFSATVGSLVTLTAAEQQTMLHLYVPWALQVGRAMPPAGLLTVYYEREWETPLVELRERLHIVPAPVVVG
jgi:ubiquinone biosynthesis protein COQ4